MLGIGGIGMSSLARYFHSRGVNVSGYDLTKTPLTQQLEKEGVRISYQINPERINKSIDLVIYSPAIPTDNPEIKKTIKNEIPLKKRSEILGLITKDKYTIAVAGTHGKTTISSMIAHILKSSGFKISAFIGGISKNYESNFIDDANANIMVVEADEFDRSFLQLNPDIAIVSSMDPDHLDIYENSESLKASFHQFIKRIKPDGCLIIKYGLDLPDDFAGRILLYGFNKTADFYADKIRYESHTSVFDIIGKDSVIKNIHLHYPGKHNIENAVAAVVAVMSTGPGEKEIINGLKTYEGVRRRFDIRVEKENCIYIDDYAHHPKEISSCISAIKNLYPEKKITVIFQPHLYSRTRDFADEFAESLALADMLYLLDIYPARELPVKGITSEWLFEKINLKNKKLCSKTDVIENIKENKPELLVTLGAGDIDRLVETIEKILKKT